MSDRGVRLAACLVCLALVSASTPAWAQAPSEGVLSDAEWRRVDRSVDRSLQWLLSQQRRDGSFAAPPAGQPAITSLCVMAFVAHGHKPGVGDYGPQLQAALDYVVNSQKRNGLISVLGPAGAINPRRVDVNIGIPASYNHAMSSLMLSEVYGMGIDSKDDRVRAALERSLDLTFKLQLWPKARAVDKGGWRYLTNYDQYNADLSISGWYLMSLRSAKNAAFDIPEEPIDEAVAFIRRCYRADKEIFSYFPNSNVESHLTHAMQGAGVLALAHAGVHNSLEATHASRWVLEHPFDQYGSIKDAPHSRYHYGLFLCTLAMHQMGDDYWRPFFPKTTRVLLSGQRPNGSWPAERAKDDGKYGDCYSTALATLTLAVPNKLMPIFQR